MNEFINSWEVKMFCLLLIVVCFFFCRWIARMEPNKKCRKPRYMMKRLIDVRPGDVYIGRSGWTTQATPPRRIVKVVPSNSKPGKLTLVYELDGGPHDTGCIRRWPDFYVIVVKKGAPL